MSWRSRLRAAGLLGLVWLGSAAAAAGQGWMVDVSAGATDYPALAGDVGTRSAVLSLRRAASPWLYLAGGAPLDTAGIPWLALGAGGRLDAGRGALAYGVDAGADVYGYREPVLRAAGGGLTLTALPFVALQRGAARLELRSGLLHHSTALDTVRVGRTVHDSGARLRYALPALTLGAEGRLVRAAEGSYPWVGGGAELTRGPVAAWANAGRWLAEGLDAAGWGVGASLEVAGRATVYASLQQDADDPLYFNGTLRGWSVGVTHPVGGPRAARAVPVPVTAPAAAGVTLAVPLGEAEAAPSVAGDFNGWEPVPLRRVGDRWEITLPIPPGVYKYAFQRADGSWFVPASIPNREDDGFGGVNAVLVVSAG